MSLKIKSPNLAIYALAFGNFAAGISALIVAGISTEMANDLNVSVGQIGFLVTVFALAYAIGSPIVTALMRNIDRRTMLLLGMFIVLLGNGLVAIASNYELVFIGRIISAIGSAAFVPLAALVGISMAKPEEQGQVSAIVFTGAAVATAIGVPLGTFVGIHLGWQYSFAAVVVLAFMSIMLLWWTLPKEIQTPTADFQTFKKVFQDPLLLIFLTVTVLQFGGQMVLFAFISPWLRSLTSLGATGITTMLFLAGIGGIIGNIIAGQTTDRFGSRGTQLILIILLIAILPNLTIISHHIFLGSVLIFLWGLVGQGFVAPQLVRIVTANPPLSSASLSLNASFINVGVSLGALLGGLFVDRLGVQSLTWGATGVAGLSLIVFLISWRMENSVIKAKQSIIEVGGGNLKS